MATSDIPDPSPSHPGTLPRVLGRFDALTVVVGSIIGSGIFLKPTVVAQNLGGYGFAPIIGVWIVVGAITLFGSLALAELAAMLPQAGGPYVYLREAYGRLPAFLWGWTEFWVVRTGSLGALSVATVIYLNNAMVALNHQWGMNGLTQEVLAIAIVVGLSGINVIATRWGANVQNVTVVIKVAFLLGIIVLPLLMARAHTEFLSPWLPPAKAYGSPSFWRAVGIAMIAVLWPYDGWINIGPVAEEIRNPQRNVPFALGVGIAIVVFVYVAVNVAYHVVLPTSKIAVSEGVASDVCEVLLGPTGGIVMALGVMCSTFGAVNSNMLTGPRIYFAMARDGLLPKSIRKVHGRFQTPANAILIQAAWTVLLIIVCFDVGRLLEDWGIGRILREQNIDVYFGELPPDDAFNALTDFVIFGGSIFYALAVGAVFVLRFRLPNLERPYRTWGYPVVPGLYLAFFGAALTSMLLDKPVQSIAGTSIILLGVGFYAWARRRVREEAVEPER